MNTSKQATLSAVSATAKHEGEVRDRWSWAEASVWTDRMLTALESGVRGGKWFSLMDKVYHQGNLASSLAKVKANRGAAGVDHVSVERFAARQEEELPRLSQQLREGTYQPQSIRRVEIPKSDGTKRPLGVPTVRDRVVQGGLRQVLEPIFEKEFHPQSYGFRPGRSAHQALDRVQQLLLDGNHYVVDIDWQKYFDSIPQDKLLALVGERISDGRVLELVKSFLQASIFDGLREWTPTSGTAQGAVLSPLLGNLYLNPLDHLLTEQGYEMVRYADDMVVLCRSREEAQAALGCIQQWAQSAGLTLHPTKTQVVDGVREGFEFLGYAFGELRRKVRPRSMASLKEKLRPLTKRTSGESLAKVIATINPILRGWFNYFRHGWQSQMDVLDRFVRVRLRSLLRKRQKKKGRGRGWDQHRWSNQFFQDQGLFDLTNARKVFRQSCRRSYP